jgi:methionyl-tRNA synthetase
LVLWFIGDIEDLKMKNFYITTAIDYANGSPHLGHAYEKILADVIARIKRLNGVPTRFVTGLDEHGQKVQQGADAEGIEPLQRCDRIADEFKEMLIQLDISHDDYIRTTEDRHKKVVTELLQKLFDAGDIYQAEYEGFYSTRAEQFLQEKDKVDGEWPEIFGEVTRITEKNYFFKLSKYQDWLIEHINQTDGFIHPEFRKSQVLEFLKEPLNDLCISRPVERLSWGIPLPFDPQYVTYVWFDALVNYVSAARYGEEDFSQYWPADVHVIGKDILAPPHAVYWPIMLQACNLALPKQILAHGWWMTSGAKMSKSTGETVSPLALADQYGADAFRFFVMREMTVGQDAEFSLERFSSRYKGELGNDLGNLVSRLVHMCHQYFDGIAPSRELSEDLEKGLQSKWDEVSAKVLEWYDSFQLHLALEEAIGFVRAINKYADERAPWKLAKSDKDEDKKTLATSLATMLEGLRLANELLAPVMPGVHAKIAECMGQEPATTWAGRLEWGTRIEGITLGQKMILFPRD